MELRINAALKSTAPISFSAPILTKKKTGEKHDVFEKRIWEERLHRNIDGQILIPAQALKLCLESAARYLSESVPGKGKKTYTKYIEAGLMVEKNLLIGEKFECERLFVPSDGKKGGGKRVWKNFPLIKEWHAVAEIILIEPVLIDEPGVIERYLIAAGKFVGLGRWRPEKGGLYGRFMLENFETGKVTI